MSVIWKISYEQFLGLDFFYSKATLVGLELTTFWLVVWCSTNWANWGEQEKWLQITKSVPGWYWAQSFIFSAFFFINHHLQFLQWLKTLQSPQGGFFLWLEEILIILKSKVSWSYSKLGMFNINLIEGHFTLWIFLQVNFRSKSSRKHLSNIGI